MAGVLFHAGLRFRLYSVNHPQEVGAEDVALVGGDEADGRVKVDEMGHFGIGDKGDLGSGGKACV